MSKLIPYLCVPVWVVKYACRLSCDVSNTQNILCFANKKQNVHAYNTLMCCINSFRICTLMTYTDVCIRSFQICTQTTYLYVKGSDVCLQIITPSVQNTFFVRTLHLPWHVTIRNASRCSCQEIRWGWKIYLKKSIGAGRSTSNQMRLMLFFGEKERKEAVFCWRLTVAGLESLWSISCLVAYRNWLFIFLFFCFVLNKVKTKDSETYIGK